MKLCITALDGVFDTGLATLLDTFHTANEIAALKSKRVPPFSISLVGMRRRIRTALGFSVDVEAAVPTARPRWVIVPAPNAKQPESVMHMLQRRDVKRLGELLKLWHAEGVGVAGACIGTFVLAEAGLLNDRHATTTWSLSPLFRQRYPQVLLDHSRMVVPCRNVVTAGAALGHLDLALWFIRQASPELASQVARFMLIDQRSSQARYIIPDYLAHADPLIEQFERWARTHLAQGFSLQSAAKALNVHTRTLQRRTENVLGKSPLAFFQDLRIEHAQGLMMKGIDIASIADEVGYSNPATLRNLLQRKLGKGVRQLRSEAG